MSNRNRRFAVVAVAVAVTIVGAVLVATFVGSEKKIDQPVERRYPLDDPRLSTSWACRSGRRFWMAPEHAHS